MASSSIDNLDFLEPWIWFSDAEPLFFPDHSLSTPNPSPSPSPSITVSGSDSDSNPKRTSPSPPINGRVSKRKPRQSNKSSSTTYITANASNFQQMVQQATGVNFPSTTSKPHTNRTLTNAVHYCLPTLDTSAFLLDHHYHQSPSRVRKTCTLPDFDKLACFPTLDSSKVI